MGAIQLQCDPLFMLSRIRTIITDNVSCCPDCSEPLRLIKRDVYNEEINVRVYQCNCNNHQQIIITNRIK